jgi:predicted ferric reductase
MQNKILRNSGWGILAGLSLLPVLFWFLGIKNLELKFSSISQTVWTLGDIFGLVGFAMFALVLMLSARFKFYEKFFNGINDTYAAHHFFGGLAFCLLLFHPLLLAENALVVSFRSAALFLLPSASWPLNFGQMALFTMIITLYITFYLQIKYNIWKWTHKLMGIAFLLAFLHVNFIGADVQSNYALKIYFFILGVTALLIYLYRSVLYRYLVRTYSYTIKNVQQHPDKIWEIEMQPAQSPLKFVPGQFAFFKFFSQAVSQEPHPFSFSSNPDTVKIAVKESGDYTNNIGKLQAGDKARIEGPFGAFDFRSCPHKKQIWVAGGVGVTPFLSMIRSFSEKDSAYKIDFYFSLRDRKSLAFAEEIEKIAQKFKSNINLIIWITEEKGFINAKLIAETAKDAKEQDILICGPVPMMNALKKQFLELGVGKKQIHTEEFQLY